MNILVIGAGVVGSATGKGFINKGHDVTFLEINEQRVQELTSYGYSASTPDTLDSNQYFDLIMVTVNTPPNADNSVNLTNIKQSMKSVGRIIRRQDGWLTAVIRSTVPPTTTRTVLMPLMEEYSGKEAGKDFGVAMNPEFLRAVSSEEDFANPWATVIGELDDRSGAQLEKLYLPFGGELFRMSLDQAELVKYVNNLRNALVISFNNEIWQLASKLGIEEPNAALDVATHTAESAWNPQYGSKGGYPYGGTCLPKDTSGLVNFASSAGMKMSLLQAVIEVNEQMKELAKVGEVPDALIAGHHWKPSPHTNGSNGTKGSNGNNSQETLKRVGNFWRFTGLFDTRKQPVE